MEKTLIILKPDCIGNKNIGETLSRFEAEDFEICACKMMQLDNDLLKVHYAHIAHLPFFPEIQGFMGSRPVIVMVLQGNDIIERVRTILGPTDSTIAAKGTIRGDLGTDKMRNICHASDGPQTAAVEIRRFFKEDELF